MRLQKSVRSWAITIDTLKEPGPAFKNDPRVKKLEQKRNKARGDYKKLVSAYREKCTAMQKLEVQMRKTYTYSARPDSE
ncbi:hypothetical protein SCARR_01954 [Pontiella sulfatireligans]|uniref:Uncharacterized protein n=1 Tax=Pontiella sulfatireligans TaxID=2750658 RepID=A0A6C2UKR0_9BACT|nr:hypothetical protein SCARR_01954 [Pontiella sulfatireligans]